MAALVLGLSGLFVRGVDKYKTHEQKKKDQKNGGTFAELLAENQRMEERRKQSLLSMGNPPVNEEPPSYETAMDQTGDTDKPAETSDHHAYVPRPTRMAPSSIQLRRNLMAVR